MKYAFTLLLWVVYWSPMVCSYSRLTWEWVDERKRNANEELPPKRVRHELLHGEVTWHGQAYIAHMLLLTSYYSERTRETDVSVDQWCGTHFGRSSMALAMGGSRICIWKDDTSVTSYFHEKVPLSLPTSTVSNRTKVHFGVFHA